MSKIYRFKVEKLVRDKTPERLAAQGATLNYRSMEENEFKSELLKKLIEESLEVQGAKNLSEIINELADMQDIYQTIISIYKIDEKDIQNIQKKKLLERGVFQKRLYSEYVDVDAGLPESDYLLKYYTQRPEDYPLIKIIEN